MHDLTGFQRDLLRGIVSLTDDSPPHGLAIREWLEDEAEYPEVHHGRLYPNLDTLVSKGLVRKDSRDRRTNSYRLTPRGNREVAQYVGDWNEALDNEAVQTTN